MPLDKQDLIVFLATCRRAVPAPLDGLVSSVMLLENGYDTEEEQIKLEEEVVSYARSRGWTRDGK